MLQCCTVPMTQSTHSPLFKIQAGRPMILQDIPESQGTRAGSLH